MDACIQTIVDNDFGVLITYPNNDEGHSDIIKVIDKWSDHKCLFVSKSLGAQRYYSALYDCAFVIGNSSSALIEAPYFHKPILNIGSRQKGRDKDVGVNDIPADVKSVKKSIEEGFQQGWRGCECNFLYGDGNAIEKRKKAISKSLR